MPRRWTEDPFPPPDSERDWHAYYKHLNERFRLHQDSAGRRTRRYKRLTTVFRLGIPVMSLLVTVAVSIDMPYKTGIATLLAVSVTLLAGLNSALEPGRRYLEYVDSAIELQEWRFDFELRIDQAIRTKDFDAMIRLFSEKNIQLSQIGRRMAGNPIPKTTV